MPPMRGRMQSKPKNFKGTSKRMIKDFRSDLPLISIVILLAICSAFLSVYTPYIFNDLISTQSISSMFEYVNEGITIKWNIFFQKFGLVLGLYVISALLSWLSEFVAVSISAKYAYRMRKKVLDKIDKLPLSYFDKVPYGDTLSVGTNDVDNISRNLQSIITQVFSSLTLFLDH